MAILVDLRDPRIQDVTVTFVEVSGDMRLAKVHVSVMGDEAKQQLSLHGLQNSAGFLQQKVGETHRHSLYAQAQIRLGSRHQECTCP